MHKNPVICITVLACFLLLFRTMPEKRQFVRHPSSIPIEIRLIEGSRQSVCISDVSMGGLAFAFHWRLAIGVMLEVRVPGLADQIVFSGRVVRCGRMGREWMVGISFEDKQDAFRMRMVQQICHIEEYRKRVLAQEGREISSEVAGAEWIACYAAHFPQIGL